MAVTGLQHVWQALYFQRQQRDALLSQAWKRRQQQPQDMEYFFHYKTKIALSRNISTRNTYNTTLQIGKYFAISQNLTHGTSHYVFLHIFCIFAQL